MDHLIPTLRADAPAPATPFVPHQLDPHRAADGLGAGDSRWVPGFLTPEQAADAFARLAPGGEVPFQQWFHMPDRKRPHKALRPLRRIKAAMALGPDADGWIPHYRFPVNDQHRYGVTSPMSPTVERLRVAAEALTGEHLNHAVVLCYRDGCDSIGLHKDKVLDLDATAPIVSISLGAERPWLLRDDIYKPTRGQRVRLVSGGAFVLGPETNLAFYHSVPKVEGAVGVRISVTFRRAATFRRADGALRGQGAELTGLNWPESLRGAHRLDDTLDQALP